ncbi:S8 family serine peptidase [Sorangium sp. So ce448]|uniref:S8 family peptidase n=1 Tax=Sorangium sp. So ce448 TaxID=3133314 RepID=UPI003F5FFD49
MDTSKASGNAAEHPGLTRLQELQRAGLIRRVTPILEDDPAPRPTGEARPNASPFAGQRRREALESAPHDAGSATDGVSMYELDPTVDTIDIVKRLSEDKAFVYAERVPRYALFADAHRARPSDTASQWSLAKIGWDTLQSQGATLLRPDASAVKVAVLDTGVDQAHPGLGSNVKTYCHDCGSTPVETSDQDVVGHGTHVTGIIAGDEQGEVTRHGICKCSVHVWKIFDAPEYCEDDNCFVYYVKPLMYARALKACIRERVDVINLSVGSPEPSDFYADLIRDAISRGISVVAAMGNAGQRGNPREYPAACTGVIAVGATTSDDVVASSSSRGEHMAISAPGVGILSTLPRYPGQTGFDAEYRDGENRPGTPRLRGLVHGILHGTSMSAAHVTGAVALLKAQQPGLTPADVARKLAASAEKVPGMAGRERTDDYGHGRLNLYRLLTQGQAGGASR